jgi:hypothetical protein
MKSLATDEATASPAPVESLTFAELLRVIFEHRTLLWLGTLAGLVLGVAYIFFFGALYRSDGVMNLREVTFAEYKRYSPALSDRERFIEYAGRAKVFSDADLNTVRAAIAGSAALTKWIHPLFTMTKADVKDVAATPIDANQFTGAEIDVGMNSRDLAQKLVVVCGGYGRPIVMKGQTHALVLPGLATSVSELSGKELEILRSKFDLDRLKERRSALQAVAGRYQGADRQTQQRQVISTQDGGERYLSPVTQVIGVEAQIIEINSDLAGLERDAARLRVLIAYYKDARMRLESAKIGEQMAVLELAFADLARRSDLSGDAARDAVGSIRAEIEELRAYNTDYLRLAGTPVSRSQIGSILVWAPVLLATLIAFVLSLLSAIVMTWWRHNRSAVFGAPG